MNIIVGVGELQVSYNSGDVIMTYSLGSCLGLSLYDPVAGVGGILHAQLPSYRISKLKAESNPGMFVDTGTELLFKTAYAFGAKKERMIIKLAGCNNDPRPGGVFKIGERNYIMARRLLWKNNVFISAEDVGGSASRTMSLDMGTGTVKIKKGVKASVI